MAPSRDPVSRVQREANGPRDRAALIWFSVCPWTLGRASGSAGFGLTTGPQRRTRSATTPRGHRVMPRLRLDYYLRGYHVRTLAKWYLSGCGKIPPRGWDWFRTEGHRRSV